MPESNFDFLADTDPDLHDIAMSAEALLHAHPVAAIGKLRTFAEHCTKIYVRENTVPSHWNDFSQYKRLEHLEDTGELQRSILDPLHKIRRAGNDAVHNNEGTLRTAKRQLSHAYTIAVWLHVEVYDQSLPPDSFQIPKSPISETGSATDASSSKQEQKTDHTSSRQKERAKTSSQKRKQWKSAYTSTNAERVSSTTSNQERGPSAQKKAEQFAVKLQHRVRHTWYEVKQRGRNIWQTSKRSGIYLREKTMQAVARLQRGVQQVWKNVKQDGTQVQETLRCSLAEADRGIQRIWHLMNQAVMRTGQGIRDVFAWIYNTIYAFFAAIWRGIRAVGRFIKRVLKWTVFAVAVGAFVIYFPAVYATTTGWLPETTQQEIPAVEVVTETHAEWIPPETQAQVGTYAQTGAEAVQSGVYSAWTAAVAQGQRLWERRPGQVEAPDSE
jgi:hypothetical protein